MAGGEAPGGGERDDAACETVKAIVPHASDEEVLQALKTALGDPELAVLALTDSTCRNIAALLPCLAAHCLNYDPLCRTGLEGRWKEEKEGAGAHRAAAQPARQGCFRAHSLCALLQGDKPSERSDRGERTSREFPYRENDRRGGGERPGRGASRGRGGDRGGDFDSDGRGPGRGRGARGGALMQYLCHSVAI